MGICLFKKLFYLFDFLSYLYKQQVFFQIYLASNCIKCKPNFSKIAIKNIWQTKSVFKW